jgi:hypothetical protein
MRIAGLAFLGQVGMACCTVLPQSIQATQPGIKERRNSHKIGSMSIKTNICNQNLILAKTRERLASGGEQKVEAESKVKADCSE